MQPILERGSGLTVGKDFHLAFSPERVDPGREDWTTKNVPKVVGGIDEGSTAAAVALYSAAIDVVHPVSSPEAAELTKLLENIFRSVNIALVNELAQLCDRMNIDVWEVIEAAATKPFGFMSFKPGPGLGGHCIPIDPFYLTWKAREFGFYTEFIELAGKVNESMPYFCRSVVSQALNHARQRSLSGSKILVLGVAYKPDIADTRESPAIKLIGLLENAGADVSYHDPHVASFSENGISMSSQPLEPAAYDCVVVVTNHSGIDYDALVDEAVLVVDLRNATGHNGRRPTRSGSFERSRRAGRPGRVGEEPRPELRGSRRPHLAVRSGERQARGVRGPVSAGALGGDLRGDARGSAARRRRHRDARAHALRAGEGRTRGGQARLRGEASGDEEPARSTSSYRSPASATSSSCPGTSCSTTRACRS